MEPPVSTGKTSLSLGGAVRGAQDAHGGEHAGKKDHEQREGQVVQRFARAHQESLTAMSGGTSWMPTGVNHAEDRPQNAQDQRRAAQVLTTRQVARLRIEHIPPSGDLKASAR